MANEYGFISYGDTSRKEDITDLIANISPTDTPFSSMLPMNEVVNNTYHEWQEDVLAARAANARIEGLGPTWQALTAPSRLANVTQILQKDGSVSGTQKAISHAGYKDVMAYQKAKKTKEFKNDLEYNVINSTLNTGASGTARAMKGAVEFISTITSALQSAVLDETIFNDFLELVYKSGGDVDKVFVGSWLKRKISSFTSGSIKHIPASMKEVMSGIDIYDGDFGRQEIIKCRDLNPSGTGTATMLMIQSDQWKFGWLRRPEMKDVPAELDGGDQDKFFIRGEGTLIMGANAANAKVTGLSSIA